MSSVIFSGSNAFVVLKHVKWGGNNKKSNKIKVSKAALSEFKGFFAPAKYNSEELKLLKQSKLEIKKWNKAILKARQEAAKKITSSVEFKHMKKCEFKGCFPPAKFNKRQLELLKEAELEIDEWNEAILKRQENEKNASSSLEFKIVRQPKSEIDDLNEVFSKTGEDNNPLLLFSKSNEVT